MHPLIIYLSNQQIADGGGGGVPGGSVAKGRRWGWGILHRRVCGRV